VFSLGKEDLFGSLKINLCPCFVGIFIKEDSQPPFWGVSGHVKWLHGDVEQMRLYMYSRQEILKAHFKDYQTASMKGRKHDAGRSNALEKPNSCADAFWPGLLYHKNDNCYAEQKNYDAVRKTVGYFRFDTAEECAALAEVYLWLCPLY